MDIYRKIAIVLIVVLFSYIFLRLLDQQIKLKKGLIEGFTPTDSNVVSIQNNNTIPAGISNMSRNYAKKVLNQMYIKAAYGGGYDGVNVSSDMLLYTLSMGYRYLVIHVFYDVISGSDSESTKTAVVGFSDAYPPTENIAKKTMALSDVLQLIQQNAFSPTSPNPDDPFFLHILPVYQTANGKDTPSTESTKGFNTQLNTQIEQTMALLQNSNRTSGPVDTAKTTLAELQGKFVVVMDTESTQGLMTDNLKQIVGLSIPLSKIKSTKNMKSAGKKGFNVVFPTDEKGSLLTSPPPYVQLYQSYQINVSPICPWLSRYLGTSAIGTTNLGDYEQLFSKEGGSSFISLIPPSSK